VTHRAPPTAAESLSESFEDVLELASADPVKALRIWEDELMPSIEQSGAGAGSISRRFERVARIALTHVTPELLEDVERTIVALRKRLVAFADRRRATAVAFAKGFRKAARFAVRTGASAPRPVKMRELRDVLQLEERLTGWTEGEALDWLVESLDRARSDPPMGHLAFRPLRLFPGQRLIEQLAAGLLAGERVDARTPTIVRDIVAGYLRRDIEDPAPDLERDLDMWRLITFMSPNARTIADARRYLRWLSAAVPGQPIRDRLVEAVCNEVAATTPVTGAQSTFFRWLRRDGVLWRPEFARDLAAAEEAEASVGLISNVAGSRTSHAADTGTDLAGEEVDSDRPFTLPAAQSVHEHQHLALLAA
jgi:hypothetical protein